MQYHQLLQVFFSPNGTTRQVVERIAQQSGVPAEPLDLLRSPLTERREIPAGTLVVVGMPVYAGRIPPHCRALLRQLHAKGTPAIAAAVYGNRDYDDALLELSDLLTEQGFSVVGAGAFIARHCIFPQVAADRPDERDLAEIDRFSDRCRELIAQCPDGGMGAISVKGNPQYREPGPVPLKPSGDQRCTACGLCAKLCPMGAIDAARPRETDGGRCISCGACIHNCPTGARGYRGVAYSLAAKGFAIKCAARRDPETFYAG